MTAPLVILHSLWFKSQNCPNVYESDVQDDEPKVLIAGFGRFGQITARVLKAHNISFTALDKNAEHIEFARKFGNKVYFGDASRLDILKTAGIAHVRVFLVAVDSEEDALHICETVKKEYPDVKIIVRIFDRMNVAKFDALGVTNTVREMFEGSLSAAEKVLEEYGFSSAEADYFVQVFKHHDEEILERNMKEPVELDKQVERSQQSRERLEKLFNEDKADIL